MLIPAQIFIMQRQILDVKLEGYLFPEQESWTPSLLGHSPWIGYGTLLPVPNEADCRGDGTIYVV